MTLWIKDLIYFYKRNHTILKIIVSLIILLFLIINALYSLSASYEINNNSSFNSYFITKNPKKFCIH